MQPLVVADQVERPLAHQGADQVGGAVVAVGQQQVVGHQPRQQRLVQGPLVGVSVLAEQGVTQQPRAVVAQDDRHAGQGGGATAA